MGGYLFVEGERRSREHDATERQDGHQFEGHLADRNVPRETAADERNEREYARHFGEVKELEERKLILRTDEKDEYESEQRLVGEEIVRPDAFLARVRNRRCAVANAGARNGCGGRRNRAREGEAFHFPF